MNSEPLSKDELLSLLSAARARKERDWLLILVTYLHALRASEATEFTADNMKDGYLTIQRKKGSLRTIQPLVEHENPLLNEKPALIELARKVPFGRPLFKMSTVQFWRLMQRYGKQAGIAQHRCHPHILKHTMCSHLIGKVDIAVIREWAGHSNLSSTGFYLRLNSGQVSAAVKMALV